jgi:hypothetical protein
MDLKALLGCKNNKTAYESNIANIEKYPDKFAELMECFFDKDIRICQNASWPVSYVGTKFPELLLPYLPLMIKNLENPVHDAVVRNTVRTWQNMIIPEEYLGEIYEKCFNYLIEPKIAIAIRAFSMTVCANIAMNIPELKQELFIAISEQIEMGSPGIRSRGQKILKSLKEYS